MSAIVERPNLYKNWFIPDPLSHASDLESHPEIYRPALASHAIKNSPTIGKMGSGLVIIHRA